VFPTLINRHSATACVYLQGHRTPQDKSAVACLNYETAILDGKATRNNGHALR